MTATAARAGNAGGLPQSDHNHLEPTMTDQPPRPEVDDPRVLALAKARQQIAYENPLNFVCPPWDGLSEEEQHSSLLDARNYLHAALKAGLVPAPAPTTDGSTPSRRAGLRDEIAAAIWERQNPGRRYADCEHPWQADAEADADAVLALLLREWPWLRAEAEDAAPSADRAAVLDEAAAWFDARAANRMFGHQAATQLRRMAAETRGNDKQDNEAREPEHRWRVELLDGETWTSDSRGFGARSVAMDRYRAAIRNAPTWASGEPVQRRLVRETTTFTVEEPAAVVRAAEPADTETRACDGFPETCPNLRAKLPDPGGYALAVRCGCYDKEPHPTQADLDHALKVAAHFHGQNTDTAAEAQQDRKCSASISGICLNLSMGFGPCDTDEGECIEGGQPAREAQQDEEQS